MNNSEIPMRTLNIVIRVAYGQEFTIIVVVKPKSEIASDSISSWTPHYFRYKSVRNRPESQTRGGKTAYGNIVGKRALRIQVLSKTSVSSTYIPECLHDGV